MLKCQLTDPSGCSEALYDASYKLVLQGWAGQIALRAALEVIGPAGMR